MEATRLRILSRSDFRSWSPEVEELAKVDPSPALACIFLFAAVSFTAISKLAGSSFERSGASLSVGAREFVHTEMLLQRRSGDDGRAQHAHHDNHEDVTPFLGWTL